jgi:Asp-tRNA(Asn)/Glu-tRNA(Gln) amidotransferase C subunit
MRVAYVLKGNYLKERDAPVLMCVAYSVKPVNLLAGLLGALQQRTQLDTSQVEPATGGLTPEGEKTDSSREDVTVPSLGQELALSQAPDAAHGHFRVPKVL